MEKFIEGSLQRLINNIGDFVGDPSSDKFKRAEAFMHYSFKRTNETTMMTDIQEFGMVSTDPEIASKEMFDSENRWNFCSGNCSLIAITIFFQVFEIIIFTYCTLYRV